MKRPRKPRLGQHFLTSSAAITAMRDASDVHADDIILEIGPGKGVLTEKLLFFAAHVIAVEKDEKLAEFLRERFVQEIATGRLDIIEGDILDFDPTTLKTYHHPYKVVANIPYYITGEILRKFLSANYKPVSMTLLIQKEVAERIVTRNGKESILSLSVKFFGEPTYIQTVKRGSFSPAPNVDSAIIHIDHISTRDNEGEFFKLIHAGFKSKRKKLFSNLLELFTKEKLAIIFDELSLDQNIRAEDVSLETWLAIARYY